MSQPLFRIEVHGAYNFNSTTTLYEVSFTLKCPETRTSDGEKVLKAKIDSKYLNMLVTHKELNGMMKFAGVALPIADRMDNLGSGDWRGTPRIFGADTYLRNVLLRKSESRKIQFRKVLGEMGKSS